MSSDEESTVGEGSPLGAGANAASAAAEARRAALNNVLTNDSDDDDNGDVGDYPTPPQPSTPSAPRNSGQDDDDDDDGLVPATPVAQNSPSSQLGTPLTPLSPTEAEDEAQQNTTNNNNVASTPDQQDDEEGQNNNQDNDNNNNDNEAEDVPEQAPPLFANTAGNDTHIRGTNIHVPTAANAFSDFLHNFRSLEYARRQARRVQRRNDDASSDDDDSLMSTEDEEIPPPLYMSQLQALADPTSVDQDNLPQAVVVHLDHNSGVASLELDARHLYYHNQACQRLYHQLEAYPTELIPVFDIVCQRELEDLGGAATTLRLQVRPFNLQKVHHLRTLDPIHMETLVSVQGMIVRTSGILPDLKVAHFSCTLCGHNIQVAVDRGRIAEPSGKCPTCHAKATSCFQLVHNRSIYSDKQWVRLQETPDQVPAGHTPASCLLFAFDDLCDQVLPGDRVEVTAVLRAQPVRTHPKLTKLRTLYKTYLDVVHYRKITGLSSSLGNGGDNNNNNNQDRIHPQETDSSGTTKWSAERVAQMQELSRDPNIYSKLVQSLAPSIWELDNVKKGVLCMLFGGNTGQPQRRSRNEDGDDDDEMDEDQENDQDLHGHHSKKSTHKRGDINILLCGDPGTSKSQLLSYVHKMSHRGVYTSGKGSSAVGLTASVVRDPETRDLVLESGALVLSDLGICCIDEFDKMSDTTRSVLHESMEQQTVSIAKAGIIATLHARTSVLASANPTESRYNPNRSVVDNIQLPPTLLSRFDLIYLILDTPLVEQDRRLAQHLVGLYYETPNVVEPPINQNLLRDYIQYARENIFPELSDEATSQLLESYLEMRGAGHANRTITATPRQLESLIRLTEALAKMRLSQVATRADAQEAVRLMRVATCSAATDPRTGRIDMDLINTGRGSEARERDQELHLAIQEMLAGKKGQRLTVRELTQTIHEVTNQEVQHQDLVEVLRVMEAEGAVQYNERAQTVFVRSGIQR